MALRPRFGFIPAIGLVLSLAMATAAHARYTAIDVITVINPITGLPEDRSIGIDFYGFCGVVTTDAFKGDECEMTYTLPYTVVFDSGQTNKISLRNDGTIQFVGDQLFYPDPAFDITQQFKVLAEVDTGISIFTQIAKLDFVGSTIEATWFTCPHPTSACFEDVHTATLTPVSGGIDIAYSNKPDQLLQASFVPEPAAWTLFILGLGAAGGLIRRNRSRTRFSAAESHIARNQ